MFVQAAGKIGIGRMATRYFGEPIKRNEDGRLLTGQALFVDDVELPGLLHAAFLRSNVAHARIAHVDVGSNVAAHVRQAKGDYAGAAAAAHCVIRRRLRYDHGMSSPIETRGIVAQWDTRAHQLTVWDTTQAPVFIRNGLAGMLGLSERQVRVIAPFVGGGFGPKIMMFYPEEVLLPWAAMRLGQPVKWIEDRREHFVAT